EPEQCLGLGCGRGLRYGHLRATPRRSHAFSGIRTECALPIEEARRPSRFEVATARVIQRSGKRTPQTNRGGCELLTLLTAQVSPEHRSDDVYVILLSDLPVVEAVVGASDVADSNDVAEAHENRRLAPGRSALADRRLASRDPVRLGEIRRGRAFAVENSRGPRDILLVWFFLFV